MLVRRERTNAQRGVSLTHLIVPKDADDLPVLSLPQAVVPVHGRAERGRQQQQDELDAHDDGLLSPATNRQRGKIG